MFNRRPKNPVHPLDEVIRNLIEEIETLDSKDISDHIVSLKALMELRAADQAAKKPQTMSPEAIANVVANLLGIGMILSFEKANVITSKSLSFVPKIKV